MVIVPSVTSKDITPMIEVSAVITVVKKDVNILTIHSAMVRHTIIMFRKHLAPPTMEVATFSDKKSMSLKLSSIFEAEDSKVSTIGKLNNHNVRVVIDNGASHVSTSSSTAEMC